MSTCQWQRPKLSSQYSNILQEDQPATWWQVDYIGLLPSLRGQQFLSPWNRCIIWTLVCPLLPAPPSVDILNALFHCPGITHNIFILTKDFYFVDKIIDRKKVRERVTPWDSLVLVPHSLRSKSSKYSKLATHILYRLSHCQNIGLENQLLLPSSTPLDSADFVVLVPKSSH